MPCRTDEFESTSGYVSPSEHQKVLDKLQLVTRVACSLAEWCEFELESESNFRKEFGNEVATWWEKHQVEDSIRKEALRKSAIAKLTKEEKEALGL